MCGTSYYGELLISIGPTVTVILKKYFFQQKRTYPIKIFFLTLGVAGGGIFFHGSLPLVGLSNHVHHVLASSRLLGVLPISAGSQAPLFSPPQSTHSSFPEVTWASTAACKTWADVFSWDILSEDICYGSLSNPTNTLWCTYGCFSCELQVEALWKIFLVVEELS